MAQKTNYLIWIGGLAAAWLLLRKPTGVNGIGAIGDKFQIRKKLVKEILKDNFRTSKSGSYYGEVNDWGVRISNHQILSFSRGTKTGEDIDIVQDDIYNDEFHVDLKDFAWNAFHHVRDLLSVKDTDGDDTQNLKYENVLKFFDYVNKVNKNKF